MRHALFLCIFVIALPAAVAAEEPRSVVDAAIDAVTVQQPATQDRVRSMGRTWAGVAMLGGGTFLAAHAATSTCATTSAASAVFDTQTCGQAWTKLGAGLGIATVGALLATVWSDVPVARSVEVVVSPGRIYASRSFGW